MINNTQKKILAYITEKKETTANDIVQNFGLTKAIIFRHLKALIETKKIEKRGTPPRVFYYPLDQQAPSKDKENIIDNKTIEFINNNYLYISPAGQILSGVTGFEEWCQKNNFKIEQKAHEYIETKTKYNTHFKNGLIDGMEKLKQTFSDVYLDELYYLDFYAIERFGKTKLGYLLLYAKQTQNKKLMSLVFDEVKAKIQKFTNDNNISAIGFIPPTVKRETQFQKELEKALNIQLPKIKLIKINNGLLIPQKSLSNLSAKVENARNTIAVDEKNTYNNILLIDDAVGSGATLNETAKKIKGKSLCSGKIIGLAITGSFKGFDVISEI